MDLWLWERGWRIRGHDRCEEEEQQKSDSRRPNNDTKNKNTGGLVRFGFTEAGWYYAYSNAALIRVDGKWLQPGYDVEDEVSVHIDGSSAVVEMYQEDPCNGRKWRTSFTVRAGLRYVVADNVVSGGPSCEYREYYIRK
jgi:opacity protein-like surface antigen